MPPISGCVKQIWVQIPSQKALIEQLKIYALMVKRISLKTTNLSFQVQILVGAPFWARLVSTGGIELMIACRGMIGGPR